MENAAWLKYLRQFLQAKLTRLTVDNPYHFKSFDIGISFLIDNDDKPLSTFSVDVKDLIYSIPHAKLPVCINEVRDNKLRVVFLFKMGPERL